MKQASIGKRLAAAGFVALVLATFSCGSDSDKKSSTCDAICDCVVEELGSEARGQCNTECAQALQAEDPNAECESRLAANGASACSSLCPAGGGES